MTKPRTPEQIEHKRAYHATYRNPTRIAVKAKRNAKKLADARTEIRRMKAEIQTLILLRIRPCDNTKSVIRKVKNIIKKYS